MKDIFFVSCTRGRKEETDLYRSLRRLGVERYCFFENNDQGLSTRYNSILENHAGRDEIIVFVHDDVTIIDLYVCEKLREAVDEFGYGVVGIAGSTNFKIDPEEAITNWMSPRPNPRNLSGVVEHITRTGLSSLDVFGQVPKHCMVLDGLFLAVDGQNIGGIRFDEQFKFDFYDLDFCLSAHQNGLALGTTNIFVNHGSTGNFRAPRFAEAQEKFRVKWQSMLESWAAPSALERWSATLAELPVCLPVSARGEHIPFLFLLFQLLRPRTYVELGVDLGACFLAACQAARRFDTRTRCVGIDAWQDDPHGMDGIAVFEPLNQFVSAHFSGCELLRTTFDDAVTRFADRSIDLLHIDGLHTYEVVSNDFQAWKPKLSKRSAVLLHGSAVRERDFGVGKFWDEVKALYPHLEFFHGQGLGVLLTGGAYPLEFDRLIAYLSASAEGRESFAKACEAAGRDLPRRLERHAPTLSPEDSVLLSKLIMSKRPAQLAATSPRRNEPCFCGSGRRYKHCHGRIDGP